MIEDGSTASHVQAAAQGRLEEAQPVDVQPKACSRNDVVGLFGSGSFRALQVEPNPVSAGFGADDGAA
jgi:hypothetical protein